MKEVILSCPTLKKEIQHILAEHKLDTPVYFLPRRLHADPKELAEYLQNTIDSFLRKRLWRRNCQITCNNGGTCNTQNARLP